MTGPEFSPYPPRQPLWTCSNSNCGKGNEGHRTACISCGTARPSR